MSGPIFWRRGQWSTLIGLLCCSISSCAVDTVPVRATGYDVSVTRLAMSDGPAWWLGKADFDQDSREDILIAGHRSVPRSRLFYGGPALEKAQLTGSWEGHAVLGQERDRHGCAVADITGNSFPDVFCTAGAEQGRGGNAHELWENRDGQRFAPRLGHGAEEASARGRSAAFFNLDGSFPPALATTVWGSRADDLPNSARIWRFTGTVFEALDTSFSDGWGGRCLVVFDINGDGLDDLFACAEQQGAALFLNDGQGDFEQIPLISAQLQNTWWWDIALTAGGDSGPARIAFISRPIKEQAIHVGRFSAALKLSDEKRISCSFDRPGKENRTYCAKVVWHDFNGDGISDLYVARRQDRASGATGEDVDDLILFGPQFRTYLPVPRSDVGASAHALGLDGRFIRLTAGESWTGAIDMVRVEARESR